MKTASRGAGARGSFSLSRSSQFKRVGSIKVSLKSVDVQRNSGDIFIVSESGKVDVHHLRLNQPLWIKCSYCGQLTELVVDRITANGLSGHWTEIHRLANAPAPQPAMAQITNLRPHSHL
jgi:hypothetical protein